MIISRKNIKEKLQKFVDSKINLNDIFRWGERLYLNCDYDDWEGNDSFSNEVLARIDMSDIDGFSKNEAKEIIKLLDSEEKTTVLIKKLYFFSSKKPLKPSISSIKRGERKRRK